MNTKRLILVLLLAIAASAANGQLLDLVEVETAGALNGVQSLEFVPGDDVLLAVALTGDSISSYERDDATGLLTFSDSEVDGAAGVDGLNMANGIAVSPDGLFAYVSSRQDDAIAVFSVSPTGVLGFVEAMLQTPAGPADGIWQNKGVAVSPDGLYVVGSGRTEPGAPKGAVALFSRDATLGTLTYLSLVKNTVTPGVSALGAGGVPYFSADGLLYLVSPQGASVTTFSIDTSTTPDTLLFESVVENGVGGVSGIGGATSIAFSQDDEHAYVTGATTSSVAHFTRDTDTGELTFVAEYVDGAGTEGLGGAASVVIREDEVLGDRLYVVGATDNAVAVFARDHFEGDLTYLGLVQDGVAGADGLVGPLDAAMSADGAYLYFAAATDDAVSVYERGTGGPGGGDAADFGDAPDPTFPTLLASDGARHTITDGALHLGALMDADTDGQSSAGADADDLAVVDDEDGVTFVDPLDPGLTADIEVSASEVGLLDAWIDWNGDGDWADAGEQIATATAVVAGTNTVNVSVPATALGESVVLTRFRLSTAGVAGPGGLAADGEVEDHTATIGVAADLSATPSADQISGWTLPYSMTITVGNAGGSDVTAAGVAIEMNASAGAADWTCAASIGSLCTAAGTGDVADSVDLLAGGSAVYTITGTIADQDPGPYVTATATVTAPIGIPDPILANNSGVARVVVAEIFLDGFESGDTLEWDNDVP